jgi:hypothetical protein
VQTRTAERADEKMAQSASNRQTSEDLSNFIDHLRTVHFTLILTCLIGVVAISSKTESSASRAYDETNILLKLRDKWKDAKWLSEFGNRYSDANGLLTTRLLVEGRKPTDLIFKSEPLGWYTFAAKKDQRLSPLKFDLVRKFDTVSDAEKVWNAVSENRYVERLKQAHDGWIIQIDGSTLEAKLEGWTQLPQDTEDPQKIDYDKRRYGSFLLRENDNPFPITRSQASAIEKLRENSRATAFLYFVDSSPGLLRESMITELLLLPADGTIEAVDLASQLSSSIVPLGSPTGDFAHSFPDVADLAKNLKTLSLIELQSYFKAEKDRTGDKIEFPLLKLPSESVAYWGTAVMFFLNLYWFVVFRDFMSRVTPGNKAWNAAWIGISTEPYSKALFVATALFPGLAAAYAIFLGADQFHWLLRVTLTTLVSVAVGLPTVGLLSCWARVQRIEREVHPNEGSSLST